MTRLARLTGRPYQSPARLSAAPGGHADAQLREVLALGVGGVDEVEREREHRVRRRGQTSIAASPIVLTRRTSPRRRSAVSSTRRWATRAELVGRDLLAQAREADEVGEADRHVACARQRARLALGGVDGLGAHRLAQVQAGHVLEHRPDHRHEAARRGRRSGASSSASLRPGSSTSSSAAVRRASAVCAIPRPITRTTASCCSWPIPDSRNARAILRRLHVGVRAHDGVDVRHGDALRAPQRHEEVRIHADALSDLPRRVARLAAHRALGADEEQPPVAAGGAQVRERHPLGLELLEELQARLARGALEPLEEAFGVEVGAHSPLDCLQGAQRGVVNRAWPSPRPRSPTRAETMRGSNCVPAQRTSSATASSCVMRRAVGAVGGHRVVGVAGEDDAAAERDLLAARPSG